MFTLKYTFSLWTIRLKASNGRKSNLSMGQWDGIKLLVSCLYSCFTIRGTVGIFYNCFTFSLVLAYKMYYWVLHILVLDPDWIRIQLDQQSRILLSIIFFSQIFALKSLGLHPNCDWIQIQQRPGKSWSGFSESETRVTVHNCSAVILERMEHTVKTVVIPHKQGLF